jgi:hypothetical protein
MRATEVFYSQQQIQVMPDKVSKLEASKKPSQLTTSIPTKGSTNH